ncbi:hypothetical protein [Rhodococcus sp. IEGM1428]|uniref:hypothetical protein n=1 Tax=Rhodococcus sp. IEGM1428 TaxID=3392191 RepID=UPI003D09BE3D
MGRLNRARPIRRIDPDRRTRLARDFVLGAYGRYLEQTDLPLSLYRIQAILLDHSKTARALVDLFHAQFDPALTDDPSRRTNLVEQCLSAVE